MIHQLEDRVKWAVGIDFDPRMINVANKMAHATGARNCAFYVLDLQKDPLDLISDFLPEEQVDVCFLLSVCMWLDNWRDVIDFAQSKSRAMLFETNGTPQQQEQQIRYLHSKYRVVDLLAETSEDDPGQKRRKLLYLTGPIERRESLPDTTIAGPADLRDLAQATVTGNRDAASQRDPNGG